MAIEVTMIREEKDGRTWREYERDNNPALVYAHLADDLMLKKVLHDKDIRSIRRKTETIDGTSYQIVTVTQTNGIRRIYYVPRSFYDSQLF